MSKIDDFFHKNLTNYEEADNQWNIPNDDIWDQAKLQFPQEKKKRRGFFWIFGGAGLLLIALLSYTVSIYNSNPNHLLPDSLINSESAPIAKQAIEDTKQEDSELVKAAINTQSSTKPTYSSSQSTTVNDIRFGSNAPNTSFDPRTTAQSNNSTKSIKLRSQENGSIDEITPGQKSSTKTDGTIETTMSSAQSALQKLEFEKSIQSVDQSSLLTIEEIAVNPDLLALSLLNTSSINALDVHLSEYIMDDPDFPKPHFSQAKTEVGISRQFYFLGLVNGVNLGSDPRDEVFLNTNIRNINLNVRHWISPKWSLQSGLYASALDGSIDFSVFFPATAEDLEILTNTEYQEVADQGSRSEEPSLMITLIDPPAINEGDEIFFAGNVDIELRALQVPLMLHRHWYKKRVEYILGAGLTFEYLTAKQSGDSFDLGINGMPVQAIITEMPIASKYYDASVYFEAGTKYHLSNNINLGATLRISVTDPIFSGLDMGFYYRW